MDCCPCLFSDVHQGKREPLLDAGDSYLEMTDDPQPVAGQMSGTAYRAPPSKRGGGQTQKAQLTEEHNSDPYSQSPLEPHQTRGSERKNERSHSLMFATGDGPVSLCLTEFQDDKGVEGMEFKIGDRDVTEILQDDIEEALAIEQIEQDIQSRGTSMTRLSYIQNDRITSSPGKLARWFNHTCLRSLT